MNTRKRFSNKQITNALQETFGKVCEAADKLGCHPDTIYERAKTSRSVARALRYNRQRLLDNAEQGLDYHVEMMEPWAVKFVLKTLGKHRGFSERPLPPEPESPLPPPRRPPNVAASGEPSVSAGSIEPLLVPIEHGPQPNQRRLTSDFGEPDPQVPTCDVQQREGAEQNYSSAGRDHSTACAD